MPPPRARPQASLLGEQYASFSAQQLYASARDEVGDRVDEMSDRIASLERRLQSHDERVAALQVHVEHVSASHVTAITDVRTLITTNSSLDKHLVAFEGALRDVAEAVAVPPPLPPPPPPRKRSPTRAQQRSELAALERRVVTRAVEVGKQEQDDLVDAVRGLLSNFRAELVATVKSLEGRCARAERVAADAMESAEGAANTANSCTQRVEALQADHRDVQSEIKQLQRELHELRSALKESKADSVFQVDKLRSELHASVKELRHELHQLVQEHTHDTARDVEKRLTGKFNESIQKLAEDTRASDARVSDRVEALNERYDKLVEGFESFGDRMGEVQSFVEESGSEWAARAQKIEERVAHVAASVASVRTQAEKEHPTVIQHSEDIRRLRSAIADVVEANNDAVKASTDRLSSDVSSMRRSFADQIDHARNDAARALDERTTVLSSDIEALQRELDSRHRRVVESTHHALEQLAAAGADVPGHVSTLKHELAGVKDSLQMHESAIDRWRIDTTAVTDLRDWLQDVERRAASKNDLEQVAATLASQLVSLRDAAINTEAILAQKLEAERSAREFEASSLRSQIQRLSTARTLLASP
jgi:chromosome segregation ATPase